MSYRGSGGGITGTNNVPLGNRRRFGGEGSTGSNDSPSPASGGPSSREEQGGNGLADLKRGRSPVRCKFFSFTPILAGFFVNAALNPHDHAQPIRMVQKRERRRIAGAIRQTTKQPV